MGLKEKKIFCAVLLLITFSFLVFFASIPGVSATHTSSIELSPEWSPSDSDVDYTITFCKDTGDDINEVRIYKNYDGSIFYSDFECDDKPGWEKLFIGVYPACFYVAEDSSYYLDQDGECTDFTFSAHTPIQDQDDPKCQLDWRFETRDVNDYWTYIYDNTSVDMLPPTINKEVIGIQNLDQTGEPCPNGPGEGEECWINDETEISVYIEDQGVCDPPSGLDFCEIKYILDEGQEYTLVEEDLDGEDTWEYSFTFDEDSIHDLTVYCVDRAGNEITDTETFRVDTTPPETEKIFEGPQYTDGTSWWIDGITTVELSSEDGGPICAIGVDKTWYQYNVYGSDEDWNYCYDPEEYCNYNGEVDYPTECINDVQDYCTDNWAQETYDDWNDCVEQKSLSQCKWDGWQLYSGGSIKDDEQSCHVLNYFSVDDLGNIENVKTDCFFVDKTPPKIRKTIGSPQASCEELGDDSCDYYINSSTPITLSCEDVGPHPAGDVTIFWKYRVDEGNGNGFGDWSQTFLDNSDETTFTFPEASIHELEYWCIDAVEKESDHHTEIDKVDNEPPILTKVVGEPKYDCKDIDLTYNGEDGDCYYIRDNTRLPGTQINLSVVDTPANHASDNARCEWGYEYNEENYEGGEFAEGEIETVTFNEDSTHILHVDCYDAVGNYYGDVEEFRVDSIPPETTKTYGTPAWPEDINDPGKYPHFITSQTPITLEADDNKVGVDKTYWGYKVVDDKWCRTEASGCSTYEGGVDNFQEYTGDVTLPEESCHLIEFYSVDKLGNTEETKRQCVFVDNTPPIVDKIIGEPKDGMSVYLSDAGSGSAEFMGMNQVHLSAPLITDYPPTNEGTLNIPGNGMTLNDLDGLSWNANVLSGYLPHVDILLENGETLTFEYSKVDPTQCDNSPYPTGLLNTFANKGIVNDNAYAWRDIPGPCGDSDFEDQYMSLEDWKNMYGSEKIVAFQIEVDGWISESESYINGVLLNEESVPLSTYITTQTPVTFYCNDQQPHPVGGGYVFYRYRISDDCESWGEWMTEGCEGDVVDGWCDPEIIIQEGKTIYFPEDSCHEIQYYCDDKLGNNGRVQKELDVVDSQAPEIEFTVNAPYYYDEEENLFIDSASSITVDAVDPQPHPVDNVMCTWSYTVNGEEIGESEGEISAPFTLQFPEESHHVLTVTCWDSLGNTNTNSIDFYADHTPPKIIKDESVFLPFRFDDYWAQWINSQTEIPVSVVDDGEHLSGIKEVKYATMRVDDEACKYYYEDERGTDYSCDYVEGDEVWTTIESENYGGFTFNIPEESCHLIEIMATDNVDKCALHKQWVYVDNTPPTPNKIVGEPKEVWNGSDAHYYDLDQFCATPGNCWKVTTMTPITLDCNDPEPHPVDHEKIFFKVELDGDDWTEQYCNKLSEDYEVEYNKSGEGYCYISGEEAPINFYFTEESEHNLKYYCEDALGNKGPVDDEKFKVEGDAFTIHLNKKWNLISVPVKLLDDSMDLVFDSPNSKVQSVWQFDGENWHVYTPDGNPGNDDISTMEPGWGYWILANEETNLTIGGSLISPAMTPPSVDIVPGWNLVGYYGVKGPGCEDGVCTEYSWPDGNGKEARCALYSLGTSYLDKGWTSLISYWEPYNPNQWSYEWNPSKFDYEDNMDPGAGYWLLAQEGGIYAPTTVDCDYLL